MNARSVAKVASPDFFDVLGGCHREIRVHLDKLTAIVSQLQIAAPNEHARSQAREVIAFFTGPAREHNFDEERHVFPTLAACDDAEVKRVAETLCEDHAWIELCWLDIEPQLAAVAAGLCPDDIPALCSAAEQFVKLSREHMAVEESVLYPQLRRRVKPYVLRSISREMAARRGAGWSV